LSQKDNRNLDYTVQNTLHGGGQHHSLGFTTPIHYL